MVTSWCWHSSCLCPAVSWWVVEDDLVKISRWWSIIIGSSCNNSQTVKNWIKNTNQKQTQSCPLLLQTNHGQEKAERRQRTKLSLRRAQWKIDSPMIHPIIHTLQLPGVSTTQQLSDIYNIYNETDRDSIIIYKRCTGVTPISSLL